MSNLELNHVYKMYPNGVKAVNDFTMEVSDKEFIVFVGPSGCGKSTTLRMIAGLEEITSGDIKIDGVIVNDTEPRERDIAMVFQNYALYPHMTVYKNMAFGLKLRHMPKNEIDDRVREAADILGITEYLNRKPKAMSGGQRQRVALGRAIVREPKIFLLDEPLSNLDAKLRAQMRTEISKLHHKLQTTFIYVTHDQVEAMTMGTRIVVMKDGFVQQIDSPRNLYRYPVNKFVAGFIGTPQMNFFKGILKRNDNEIEITIKSTDIKLNVPVDYFARVNPKYFDGMHEVYLGLRCEHISIDPDKYPFKAQCRVSHVEELGIDSQIFADFNLASTQLVNDESDTKVIIKAPTGTAFETDQVITVSLGLNHLKLFDVKTEETINPRFPSVVDTTCLSDGNHIILFGSKINLPPAIKIFGGEYNVSIPTSAISFGSTINCKVETVDETNDGTIYVLENNGSYLYMKDAEKSKYQKGDEVQIDIDLKACSFELNGQVFEPLNLKNEIVAEVIKNNVKVPHINQKGQNVTINESYCTLKINDVQFETNKELGFKLLSLKEKKIFKGNVKLQYSPYDVSFAEQGIECEVIEILDYGKELFAKARLATGEETIVLIKEQVELGPNHIVINVNNVHAYHLKNDIRLA